MILIKWMAVVIALASLPLSAHAAEDAVTTNYFLGSQDRLMIRVQTLRRNVGEALSWPALNGEFSVGANGTLSLPILGEVKAEGLTTSDLGTLISNTLRERANLADMPSTSVEVVQYRPFFILGAVQKPGKYEFQPGLTVLQAVSTAQGLLRAEDLTSAQRDVVAAGGEFRLLGAQRISLEVKLARLEAEVAGEDRLTFPDALIERNYDPRVTQAMQDEALRFEARRNALSSELNTVVNSKTLFSRELTTLEEKLKALDQQVERTRKELGVVNDLIAKGVVAASRQLAAEAAHMQMESNRLDVQLALLRAQQSLARTERDLVELPAQYRKDALDELAQSRALLGENTEKLRTAERQLDGAELRAAGAGSGETDSIISYILTRKTASGHVTRTVAENDPLEAGDVLQVKLLRNSSLNLATETSGAMGSFSVQVGSPVLENGASN